VLYQEIRKRDSLHTQPVGAIEHSWCLFSSPSPSQDAGRIRLAVLLRVQELTCYRYTAAAIPHYYLEAHRASEPNDSSKELFGETSLQQTRLHLEKEVLVRKYADVSAPNPHFGKKAASYPCLFSGSTSEIDFIATIYVAFHKLIANNKSVHPVLPSSIVDMWLDDRKAEMGVLKRTLPVESNDPVSIEYTRDAIRMTREIILEPQSPRLEEDFRDAAECAGQAHAYHEETLRRVNGPTHFDVLASSASGRLMSYSES
jgi:hypothetical protein